MQGKTRPLIGNFISTDRSDYINARGDEEGLSGPRIRG